MRKEIQGAGRAEEPRPRFGWVLFSWRRAWVGDVGPVSVNVFTFFFPRGWERVQRWTAEGKRRQTAVTLTHFVPLLGWKRLEEEGASAPRGRRGGGWRNGAGCAHPEREGKVEPHTGPGALREKCSATVKPGNRLNWLLTQFQITVCFKDQTIPFWDSQVDPFPLKIMPADFFLLFCWAKLNVSAALSNHYTFFSWTSSMRLKLPGSIN